MRIVIVGGGVIALLTAIECVSAGHEVELVEAGSIPFSGATSFDRHRVLRALHAGDPASTAAAVRAHHRWAGLQDVLATRFYQQVGALTVLPERQLGAATAMLTEVGSPVRVLDPDELASSYPRVGFPAGASAVFESHAGVLLADRVLTTCVGWLRWHRGAELRPHRSVARVDADAATVLLADGEVLSADAVLVAAGPWSRALLPPAVADELVLYRQSMIYCDVPAPDLAAWAVTPPMLSLGGDRDAWLVPPVAGTPLKLSAASACRAVPEVGDNTTAAHWRDHLVDVFAAVIPGLSADWLIDTRDCYYLARAATQGPMLVELGERVLCYAACGGASFKFAPLIAESLTKRLAGGRPVPTGLGWLDVPIAFSALRGVS